jgi:rhomboid protease GluP
MQDDPARQQATSAGQDASRATTPSPASAMDERWYLHIDGTTSGPYAGRDVERMLREGRIHETDLVCREGGTEWTEARSQPAFRWLGVPPIPSAIERPAADVASQPPTVFDPKLSKLWRIGLSLTVLGLVGLIPMSSFMRWYAGGPAPETGQFFALFCLVFFPFGILSIVSALRGLPRLEVTGEGVKLHSIISVKWANWDSLENFTLQTRYARRSTRVQVASAKIVGSNTSKGFSRRSKAFVVPDLFRTPIATIAAELNAARARALGDPYASASPDMVAQEPAIGLATFRLPWLTFAILAVLIVVFVIEIEFGVTPSAHLTPSVGTLLAMGAVSRATVFAGEWYRLFTSTLLHANPAHLIGNGIALVWGGWLLERLVGRVWFFAFFAVGALGGSLLSIAIRPPLEVSVGASGALMGLFAALFVASFRATAGSWTRQRLQINSMRILIPSMLPTFSSSGLHVDYGAHVGGAISGAILAAVLLKFWPPSERIPQLRKVAVGIATAGAILFVVSAGFAVANYERYDIVLIPPAEFPKTEADRRARAADLAARYPNDPRSHLFLGQTLAIAKDTVGAEREFRLALATVQAHDVFGPQMELAVRDVLASYLAQEGKSDEAKDIARPTCTAASGNPTIDKLRKDLADKHLCD